MNSPGDFFGGYSKSSGYGNLGVDIVILFLNLAMFTLLIQRQRRSLPLIKDGVHSPKSLVDVQPHHDDPPRVGRHNRQAGSRTRDARSGLGHLR